MNLLNPSSSNAQHFCLWQASVNPVPAVLSQKGLDFCLRCTNSKSPWSKTSGTWKSDCFYLCCESLENSLSAFIGSLLRIQWKIRNFSLTEKDKVFLFIDNCRGEIYLLLLFDIFLLPRVSLCFWKKFWMVWDFSSHAIDKHANERTEWGSVDWQRESGDPWVNCADPIDSVFNAANQRTLTTRMKRRVQVCVYVWGDGACVYTHTCLHVLRAEKPFRRNNFSLWFTDLFHGISAQFIKSKLYSPFV